MRRCGKSVAAPEAQLRPWFNGIHVSSELPPNELAGRNPTTDRGFRLTMRTSMLSEYRDAAGALGAFELSLRFTSSGALRTVLAQLIGVRFETTPTSLWTAAPNRFAFRDRTFEISVLFADIRIAPAEAGAIYPETENLLPRWQHRARSRFFRA
jgi:hypothetical protein